MDTTGWTTDLLPDRYLAVKPPLAEGVVGTGEDAYRWNDTSVLLIAECGFAAAPVGLREQAAPPTGRRCFLGVDAARRTMTVMLDLAAHRIELAGLRAPLLQHHAQQGKPLTVLYVPTRPDGEWSPAWLDQALRRTEVLWADVLVQEMTLP